MLGISFHHDIDHMPKAMEKNDHTTNGVCIPLLYF